MIRLGGLDVNEWTGGRVKNGVCGSVEAKRSVRNENEGAKPAVGEHSIGYAYPSSTLAKKMGRAKTGCHYVDAGGATTAVDSYSAAAEHAKSLGTKPNRWSMDHQANEAFLQKRG